MATTTILYKVSGRVDHIGMDMKVERGEYVSSKKYFKDINTGDVVYKDDVGAIDKENSLGSCRFKVECYCFEYELESTIQELYACICRDVAAFNLKIDQVKHNVESFDTASIIIKNKNN